MIKYDTNKFIEKSKLKHGDKYDYSLVDYKNDRTKVLINCPHHGEFSQIPNSHYVSGCPNCGLLKRSESRKNNINDIISKFRKIHSDRYDYSKVEYVKMRNKVLIRCKKHDFEFYQSPMKHLDSKTGGCIKCNSIGKGSSTRESFIEKANLVHQDKYQYDLTDYKKSNKKIKINCSKHGVFEMTPNSHLNGRGCGICNRNGGIIENIWLNEFNIDKDYRQYKIGNVFVDGIDLKNKIIYEFYGDFWHGNPNIYNQDDVNNVNGKKFGYLYKKTIDREECLKLLGYKIVSIWESDYKNNLRL